MTGFRLSVLSRSVALAAVMVAGLLASSPAAQAQSILAQVNSRAITSMDVAQRVRIAQMVERRRIGAREALEELIDDQAKVIEASRVGYKITDDGVETEFAKIAKSNGHSVRDLEDQLRRSGLEPNALRDKIRANIAWQALSRDRVKLGTNVTRSEVENAAAERKRTGKHIEYTLVPVVFIVPPGSSPGARAAAANAARSRFSGCDNGFDALRAMPDVFIRPSTVRNSNEISKELRALLDRTAVGQMTPAAAGEQGVESIAVCAKRDVSNAESTDFAGVADELAEKKVQSSAKTYLAELRKKVTIRYHR